MLTVDNFLEGLRQSGQSQSQGHFTIDPERLRAMLENFQVRDPTCVGIHVVAAAVAGGARGLNLTCAPNCFTAELEGQEWTAQDWQDALPAVFTGNGRLREMGLALQCGKGLGAARIDVQLPGGGLRMRAPRYQWEPCPELTGPGRFLTMDFPAYLPKGGTASPPLGLPPAYDSHEVLSRVQSRCQWAPLRVNLNGHPMSVGRPPFRGKFLSVMGMPAPGGEYSMTRRLEALGKADRALLIEGSGELTLVVLGVSHRVELPVPMWALVYADGLRKDLASEQPLESEVEALVREIRAEFARLLQARAEIQAVQPLELAWAESEESREWRRYLTPFAFQRHTWSQDLPPGLGQELMQGLESFPICPLLSGGWASLRQMKGPAFGNDGTLYYLTKHWTRRLPDYPVLDLRDSLLLESLRQDVACIYLQEGERALLREADRLDRLEIFRNRPATGPQLEGRFWAQGELTSELVARGWHGVAGLSWSEMPGQATLHIYLNDRLLQTVRVPVTEELSGIQLAVQHATLGPDPDWKGAMLDERTLEQLRAVYQAMFDPLHRAAARSWLAGDLQPAEPLRRGLVWCLRRKPGSILLGQLPLFPLACTRSVRQGQPAWMRDNASWNDLSAAGVFYFARQKVVAAGRQEPVALVDDFYEPVLRELTGAMPWQLVTREAAPSLSLFQQARKEESPKSGDGLSLVERIQQKMRDKAGG